MARYCGNCGSKLEDGARVCGVCGTPVDDADFSSPARKSGKRDGKKFKKLIKRAILFVVIAAILCTGGYIAYSYTGYRGAANGVMRAAYKDYDLKKLVALSSSLYEGDTSSYLFNNFIKSTVSYDLDTFDNVLGSNYRITYKLTDAYKLSNRQREQLLADLNNDFNLDTEAVISSVEVVTVDVTATSKQKPYDISIELYFSKEGNRWLLLAVDS